MFFFCFAYEWIICKNKPWIFIASVEKANWPHESLICFIIGTFKVKESVIIISELQRFPYPDKLDQI